MPPSSFPPFTNPLPAHTLHTASSTKDAILQQPPPITKPSSGSSWPPNQLHSFQDRSREQRKLASKVDKLRLGRNRLQGVGVRLVGGGGLIWVVGRGFGRGG